MSKITLSISNQQSKKNDKLFTYGFKEVNVDTLGALGLFANKASISGPTYKGGHRKGENIVSGSNVILIDCDEPGQAEAVERRLRPYDYVKVPSASNLEKDHKYHYILPTQQPLSVYPSAMAWQVEQFFRQVGITDDMIDTSGSYDAVRQFAPAMVGMSLAEAVERSEVNETELNAPIITEPPLESCTASAKSQSVEIDGLLVSQLPSEHLWYQGTAITYQDATSAVRTAFKERKNEDDKIIVSGFGCPHNNSSHRGDITTGYGFAFVGSDGDVIVKCTGNACSKNPSFVVPEALAVVPRKKITAFDLASAPAIVRSFNEHWEKNLDNISSPALQTNWKQNFDAFDEIILRNRKDRPGKKICCPSPTGSGKTQQIIHKAIKLHGTKTGTLIVTMRNADADIIASEIKEATHDDYVAVFHTSEVTVEDVRKAEHPDDAQCLIISHEMFRRREKTITLRRDFIVIDEAINVISQNEMEETSLRNILKLIGKYGKDSNKRLMSEKRMIEEILKNVFDVFRETGKAFSPSRATNADKKLNYLHELEFHAVIKMVEDPKTRISPVLTGGYFNQKMDDALKAKYSSLASGLKFFFKQFTFLTRVGNEITLTTASEMIPKKSIVIMDATASVNQAYSLYMEYQPKQMKVLDAIDCRDYKSVNLHTVRSATGRNTIIGSDEKKTSARLKKLFDNIILNSEPGEDILLVSFLKLEAEMMTYAEAITDRKIHVNHWGNLTGTNTYQHCHRIFIYGLNHKKESVHRSVHALAKTAKKSFEDNDENKLEMKSLVTSDLVAEVIQAINRIRCRRVIDSDGNCDVADVYLTLPAGFSDASVMLSAIRSEMTNINVGTWDIEKEDAVKLARVYSIESFMRQLEISLTGHTVEIPLGDVLNQLSMTKEQYRTNIKNKPAFSTAIDQSVFYMEMRHRLGSRGRVMKTKEPWFCLGT